MQTFSEVISKLLEENVGSGKRFQNYRKLAEAVGTSHTTFTFLTQNRIKNPNPELLRRISQALTGNTEYLLRIFAEKTLGITAAPELREGRAAYHARTRSGQNGAFVQDGSVAVVSGDFEGDVSELVSRSGGQILPLSIPSAPAGAFALRLETDAMAPRYLAGDYVVAYPDDSRLQKQPVVFKIRGQRIDCRLWSDLGTSVALLPANPAYEPQTVAKDQILWFYPVGFSCRFER